jgi:hypothetical protein
VTTGRPLRAPPARSPIEPDFLEPGRLPTFSVAIPAHNAVGTIVEAVESALAQTLPPLEVIVVDDGSTDGTAAALESYSDRIRYVRQEQGGAASARNAALRIARGDFFALLDADDAYLPERLEALAALSSARPDLDLLCTDLAYVVDGHSAGRFGETCPFEIDDQRTAILERCFCAVPAVRRAALVAVGGFDESIRTADDWDCAIRLIHNGSVAGLVDEPLYSYRIHGASLTADRIGTLRERIDMLERIGGTQPLSESERAGLARSLSHQRTSLALAEAEVAVRARSADARRLALAAARSPGGRLRYRLAAFAAVVAPLAVARGLERRDARRGDNRLRSPVRRD